MGWTCTMCKCCQSHAGRGRVTLAVFVFVEVVVLVMVMVCWMAARVIGSALEAEQIVW